MCLSERRASAISGRPGLRHSRQSNENIFFEAAKSNWLGNLFKVTRMPADYVRILYYSGSTASVYLGRLMIVASRLPMRSLFTSPRPRAIDLIGASGEVAQFSPGPINNLPLLSPPSNLQTSFPTIPPTCIPQRSSN